MEDKGRVVTEATIENVFDLYDAERGVIPIEQVRRLVLKDALADPSVTYLTLTLSMIEQLGLTKVPPQRVTNADRPSGAGMYSAVRLTIHGRFGTMDVLGVPDEVPVLIGQIPLEHLDFILNMRDRTLVGNPAHGGEHMYEMF